jgi:hypothetical protein
MPVEFSLHVFPSMMTSSITIVDDSWMAVFMARVVGLDYETGLSCLRTPSQHAAQRHLPLRRAPGWLAGGRQGSDARVQLGNPSRVPLPKTFLRRNFVVV